MFAAFCFFAFSLVKRMARGALQLQCSLPAPKPGGERGIVSPTHLSHGALLLGMR
jgi:hypothetical protein